ncbi:hypothetical protein WS91_02840 [Burkholderia sp. MSMB1498]|nr:hypothetical protein WS91_02840 [Burkholderia sp. MSMB1498]
MKIACVVLTLIGVVLFVSGTISHLEFIGKLGMPHDMQVVSGLTLLVTGLTIHLLSGGRLYP